MADPALLTKTELEAEYDKIVAAGDKHARKTGPWTDADAEKLAELEKQAGQFSARLFFIENYNTSPQS